MTQDTKKKIHTQDHTTDPKDNLAGMFIKGFSTMTVEEKKDLLEKLAAEQGMVLKKAGKDNKDEFTSGVQAASLCTMDFCARVQGLISGAFAVTVGRDVDGCMFCETKRLRKREVKAKEEKPTEEPAPAPQPTAPATT